MRIVRLWPRWFIVRSITLGAVEDIDPTGLVFIPSNKALVYVAVAGGYLSVEAVLVRRRLGKDWQRHQQHEDEDCSRSHRRG